MVTSPKQGLDDSVVKYLPAMQGLTLGQERSGGGNGNPLQYSCLENPMDRGAWQARVHGVKSWTQLNSCTHTLELIVLL